MKLFKFAATLIFFLALMMSSISCHKENLAVENKKLEEAISEKINNWLDKQKLNDTNTNTNNAGVSIKNNSINVNTNGFGQNKKANIELLKKNLDFSTTKKIKHNNEYDFLIIPINDDFKSEKKIDENSILNLLLVVDKRGNIISGNIVHYLPADKKKHDVISSNSIQNIFDNQPVPDEGMFKFLDVGGPMMYQFEYKKGKLYSFGIVKSQKNSNGKKSNNTCIDWYLVTTYYYADGSVWQTREYVYTTCNNAAYDTTDGSGGSGSSSDTTKEVTIETITSDDYESADDENGSGISLASPDAVSPRRHYDPIKYTHVARITYASSAGIKWVENVEIDPTSASPTNSEFVDSYGYSGIRTLTLLAHVNTYELLIPPLVMISWKCDVHGLYVTSDRRVWTLQWTHTRTKLF